VVPIVAEVVAVGSGEVTTSSLAPVYIVCPTLTRPGSKRGRGRSYTFEPLETSDITVARRNPSIGQYRSQV
jgi:hypothetical protein